MRNVYIYALINPITSHVFYIGASIQPRTRYIQHIDEARYTESYKCSQIRMIVKNGLEVDMEILDECDGEQAQFWEQFYIDLFFSFGYSLDQCRISSYIPSLSQKSRIEKKINIGIPLTTYRAIQTISAATGTHKSTILNIALKNLIKKTIYNEHEFFSKTTPNLFEEFSFEQQ